jgi:hypothetical protein
MSSFPGSPRLVRGALISYELAGIMPQVVIFQYNPETIAVTKTIVTILRLIFLGAAYINSTSSISLLRAPPFHTSRSK